MEVSWREKRAVCSPKNQCPGWFCKDCPPSCVTYLIMFLLLVQLMLCHAVICVLNLVWEQVGAVHTHWRVNKQQTLSSWSVPHPHGCQLCHLSMCSQHAQRSIPNPKMLPLHRPRNLLYHTVYLLWYAWVLDLAVINDQAAGAGKQ